MASFDDLYALIEPELASAPPSVSLRWATLRAARRFAQESRTLRMPCVLDTVARQSLYQLVANWPVNGGEQAAEQAAVDVIGCRAVEVDGTPYMPASPQTFAQSRGCEEFVVYEPDEIEIFPTPTSAKAGALAATVVLMPKVAATVLPRKLVKLYAEQIAAGAVAILKAMPNEAWSDPVGAREKQAWFDSEISSARAQADMQAMPHGFRVKAYP